MSRSSSPLTHAPSEIEVFGPVMVIIRTNDVDGALRVQQRSRYGNAASVFTESGGVARHVMEKASAGMVGVNVGVPVPREPFGFGGWGDSAFGVGDITGRGSIERKPLVLEQAAVLTRAGDGWSLAPTRLTFAGGTATLSGRSGSRPEVHAQLQGMPSGVASVTISKTSCSGIPPT